MIDTLAVGLASWIIQDGNYGDFARGDHPAFALEFYDRRSLEPFEPKVDSVPSLIHEGNAHYHAVGRVVYVAGRWCVIDFGVLVFRKAKPPQDLQQGSSWVQGEIYLGVDPFFYFENLASEAGAPALTYDWEIERIEMQTGPLIEVQPKGPLIYGPFVEGGRRLVQRQPVLQRDPTRLGWREVPRTDARRDDGGRAEYVLQCRPLDGPARRTLK